MSLRLWRLFFRVALFLVIATMLPVLCFRWLPPPTSSYMLQRIYSAWQEERSDFQLHYRWVDLDDVSPHFALAVIAAEDQLFPEHYGFDVTAIRGALQHNKAGGRIRGASTISQQVARNLFLWSARSYVRKGVEAWFTLLIELLWSKERILEVYLNVVELGDGLFGVAVASEVFYSLPADQVGVQEAALLAAVLPNPHIYRVDRPSRYVLERRAWIIEQMRLLGGVDYLNRL